MSTLCPKCYKTSPTEANFCRHCGKSFAIAKVPLSSFKNGKFQGFNAVEFTDKPKKEEKTSVDLNFNAATWLCLLATGIFALLKINPGGDFSSCVESWPWFAFWGASVFAPVVYGVYISFSCLTAAVSMLAVAHYCEGGVNG